MAQQITISSTFSGQKKQGSYGEKKNQELSLTFSGLETLKNKVIVYAVLTLNCAKGGLNNTKTLNVSLTGVNCGNLTTTSNAYGQETTVILPNDAVTTWIENNNIYTFSSLDPVASSLSYGSTTKYSKNYLVIESPATLTIIYEEGESDFTLSSSVLNVSAEKNYYTTLTVNTHISGNTYNVDLIMQGEEKEYTFMLAENESSSTFSFQVVNSAEGLMNDVLKDKTSATGTLQLSVYSGNSSTPKYTKSQTVMVALIEAKENGFLPSIVMQLEGTTTSTLMEEKYYLFAGTNELNVFLSVGSATGSFVKKITAQYTDEYTAYSFSYNNLASGNDVITHKITIPAPISSGTHTILFTITDSRGYEKTIEASNASVYATTYALPTFSSASIERVDSNGNPAAVNGEYAKITYNPYYTSSVKDITGNDEYINKIESIILKQNGTVCSFNEDGIISEKTFDTASQYIFTLTITDSIQNSTTKTLLLPSASYLLHFAKNSNSVAIGTVAAANSSGLFTVAWDSVFKKNLTVEGTLNPSKITLSTPLEVSYGGTGASSQSGAFENIISPGGTIAGDLTLLSNNTQGEKYLAFKGGAGPGPIKIGINFDNNTNKKYFFFDYEVVKYTLPTHTNFLIGKTYEILTSKDYSASPIYKTGDTFIIDEACAYGWVAASGYGIYLCFPLNLSFVDIDNPPIINVNALKGIVRAYDNYFASPSEGAITSSTSYDFSNYVRKDGEENPETIWSQKQKVLKITIQCTKKLTPLTDCPVSYFGSLSLSFT